MPVLTNQVIFDGEHFAFNNFNQVKYPYLADIIPLGDVTNSIGDLLMISAIIFDIAFVMVLTNKKRSKESYDTRLFPISS